MKSLKLVHKIGNPAVRRQLLDLPLDEYDSVLILADQQREMNPLDSDAHNLASMLLIRDVRYGMQEQVASQRLDATKELSEGSGEEIKSAVGLDVRSPGGAESPEPPARRGLSRGPSESAPSPKRIMVKQMNRKWAKSFRDLRGQWHSHEEADVQKTEEDGMICCEILDSRTRNTLFMNPTVAREAEYVLSHRTIAKVIAMIAMRREVRGVLEELLAEEGSSLFVFPATRYILKGEALSFWELSIRIKSCCDELLVGYQISGRDLCINPTDKHKPMRWHDSD